uniref:Enoyl reductase (ER) domain-containing protein n=1 Tax=Dunaliella tertiolecta TaxID=3047 RepID=A0A7S3QZ00_DUNTE
MHAFCKHGFSKPFLQVAACSVNPVDVKLRKANLPAAVFPYPKVTCSDGSGAVIDAPPKSKFKPGDLIYWMGSPLAKYGSAANITTVPEENAEFVQHTDIISAAALPLVVNTAWQALEKSMPLAGKNILIQAGSGGVGTAAIQIAAAHGAHVTTTASQANFELCKSLGAERVVDYKAERFEDSAPPGGYDCVLNTVDGDYDTRSLQVVKQGGHFSQVMRNVANPGEWIMGARCKFLTWTGRLGAHSLVAVRGRADLGLQQASKLMAEGKMKPVVNTVLPLNQINEAHNMVEKGVGRGKVLVKMVENVEQLLEGVAK